MGFPPGPAARLEAVLDPVIPRLGELLRRRPDALSLAQGMVDWAPPAAVRQAVRRSSMVVCCGCSWMPTLKRAMDDPLDMTGPDRAARDDAAEAAG